MNFGRPGVALFESIKSPGNTLLLFSTPSSFILSFVCPIKRDSQLVASAIFTHGIPSLEIKSWIGLGDAPLVTSHSSENLYFFHSDIEPQPRQILFNLRFQFIILFKLRF